MRPFLVTDYVPDGFNQSLEKLGFEVVYKPTLTPKMLGAYLKNIEGILVRGKIRLDREILLQSAKLKYILRPGSGLDIIDIETAKEKDILLINSPEGNRDSVAEHAAGMLLGLVNHIQKSFNEISRFQYIRKENTGTELMGKTLGIIGYGNTGSAFARKLSGFDMTLLAYDKYKIGFQNAFVRESTLDEIFSQADIVSFHVPYNKETHYMADSQFLSAFQKEIILINTSRGKVVNTSELLTAIEKGKVAGACLDVLENEKLGSYTDNEKHLLNKLLSTDKVLVTPHLAGWTNESDKKIFDILIEKLSTALIGSS